MGIFVYALLHISLFCSFLFFRRHGDMFCGAKVEKRMASRGEKQGEMRLQVMNLTKPGMGQ